MRKILSLFAAVLFLAFAANAKVINVDPGANTLLTAIAGAGDGDEIVLSDKNGDHYTIDNYIVLGKSFELKAAEGAKPVVDLYTYIKVQDNASVKITGITFDAATQGTYDHFLRIYEVNTLELEGCEFLNAGNNAVIKVEADQHINTLKINNCLFNGGHNHAINVAKRSDKHACDKVQITNSTFANFTGFGDALIRINAKGSDFASDPANDQVIEVDHCTFYNFIKNADNTYGFIDSRKSTLVTISNCIFVNPAIPDGSYNALATQTYGGTVTNCLDFGTKGHRLSCANRVQADPLFADAENGDFTLDENSPAVDVGSDGKTLGDPRWWPVIKLPETDFSEPFVCRPAKAKLSGRIVLVEAVGGDTLKWNNNGDATQNGVAKWHFHATKGCFVTGKVFINDKNGGMGHLFTLTLLDENGDAVDAPIAETSDSWGAGELDIPGDLLVPRAGDYIIQLTNPNTGGWSTSPVDSIMLSYKDEAPVYYLKGIWNDDAVSSVKQMECVGREDFILENVVLRGTGVNYSTDPAFSGGGWAPSTGFLGEQPASLDTLTLEFNSTTQDVTCTILGKYVPPTYAIAKADMAYGAITVEGDITESEAGETIKLYINPFQYYELDELSVESGSGPVIVTIDATTKKEATFVMPAEAVTISATFKLVKHTVTFSAAGAEGIIPAAIHVTHGESVTIPVNQTLFIEGKTLTKWNDGTADHAIGSTFTPDQDTILYAVFENNVIDILDLTTDLEIKWEFGESNGAPLVHFESGVGIGLLVTQAIVGGARVDVKLDIDATAGKFFNKRAEHDNWAQVNATTLFKFPSKAGALVHVKTYKDPATSLLDDATYDDFDSNVALYAANPTLGVSTFTVKDGDYYEYLQVTLPAKKFTVALPVGLTGGTVEANKTSAKATEEIELTITPAAGYVLEELTVETEGGDPVLVANNKFEMPAANVVVAATFKAIFAVNIDPAIENGTVEADKATAAAGETVTLTITPDAGYELATLTVKKADESEVAVTANAFEMPAAAVTVSATFKLSKMSLTQFVTDKPATEVTLKDLTVILGSGKNVYVIDEDGVAVVMYDASKTYYNGDTVAAGKVISGQKATFTAYKNQAEIIPTNKAVLSAGVAPVPTTLAAIPTLANENQYVRLENLEIKKASDNKYYYGDKVLQVYGSGALAPTKDGSYNVEGIIVNFNPSGTTYQLELIVTKIESAEPPFIPEGEGTEANPYTVADVIGLAVAAGTEEVWVQGFVITAWDGTAGTESLEIKSNIVLADDAAEATVAKMIGVNLPTGDIRNALNIVDNAYLIGKQISVKGKLQSYFSAPGVKGTSDYKKPEKPTAIDNAATEQKAMKMIENGQLFIIKNGKKYNALGELVK